MEIWNVVHILLALFVVSSSASGCTCPDGFTLEGDFCYGDFTDTKSWQDAESYCNQITTSDGTIGHLVSIHSEAENDFITDLLGDSYPESWVGIHVRQNGAFDMWTDNTPVNYSSWSPGEPNNSGPCCETNHYHYPGKWDDEPCDTLQQFVCKIPATLGPTNATFWTSFAVSMYRFYSDEATWDEASAICESESAHLVIIDNDDENEFVSTLTASSTTKHGPTTWIGLREKPHASFMWADGQNYTGTYNKFRCVYTNAGKKRGAWNNSDCFTKMAFVCEKCE